MTSAYLRPKEAAKFLSVSERTLRDWTHRGIIPHYKPARRVSLFAVKDLEKAMSRYRAQAVGEGA